MEVTIINFFRDGHVIKAEGEPVAVERQLRDSFRFLLSHVPPGDLESILDELSRSYGLEVAVKGFTPPVRSPEELLPSYDPRDGEVEVTEFRDPQ